MNNGIDSATTVDPITLQVIGGALDVIAEEMAHVLYRMSFSSIIRESQDFGAGLFDAQFQTLCESESTPMHIGSIPAYLRGIQETLVSDWAPGDIVIHNHPFYGASHSPDIAIIMPIFVDGELVAFAGSTAHHIDIGAATPGLTIDVQDMYGEGMLLAGMKLYDRGVKNESFEQMIRFNSRMGDQVIQDLDAQIAAARLGASRFEALISRYTWPVLNRYMNALMDYTEERLKAKIREIPDGVYTSSGYLDDDGKHRDKTLPIKVSVSIEGDQVTVDLTGSAPQVETAFNVPFEGSCKVSAYGAFRKLLLDAATMDNPVHSNEGSFRPINVIAPLGCIYNPKTPAASQARFAQCNRMIDLIIQALAPVLPEKAIASSSAALSFVSYAGTNEKGDYWVFLEVNEGSYGGRPRSDGPDSIDSLMANTRNNPIEDLGMHLPMICDRYELRDDVMPAAGRFRGGIGVVKCQRMLTDGYISSESDRQLEAPTGLFGGQSGVGGSNTIYNMATPDDRQEMPGKFSGLRVKAGDVFEFRGPCGGGYGEPKERDPDRVLADVLDGYISSDAAKRVYGVVITENMAIDREATTSARAKL